VATIGAADGSKVRLGVAFVNRTASAMGAFEDEIEKAVVLALFVVWYFWAAAGAKGGFEAEFAAVRRCRACMNRVALAS